MLIILEGADGVGKTTLAEALQRELQQHRTTEVLHRGPPEFHPLVEYELALEHYRPMHDRHIICDRWHWGELIYGPLYRGESNLDVATLRHIEMFLASRGAFVVLLTSPRSEIHRRLDERGETFLQPEDRNDVIERYYTMQREADICGVVLAKHEESQEDALQMLMQNGAAFEHNAARLNVHSTYVGPPNPYYLLLGERRGPSNPAGHSSAFVPYPSTSGAFLLKNLPDDVASHCGIANALEDDVYALWQTLGQPRVVTLGREAHDAVEKTDLSHGSVPHPQYVRRFHHSAGEEYGRVIRDAGLFQLDLLGWRPS